MSFSTFQMMAGRFALLLAFVCTGFSVSAQVTTSSITGSVTDKNNEPLVGASVVAVHTPSNSRYGTTTNASGRYTLPAVRVGGPYTVTVTYTGFEAQTRENLTATLGTAVNASFTLSESAMAIGEVAVTAARSDIFSSDRTGAATNINNQAISTMPTLSRSLNDFLRLTPQSRSSSVASTAGSGTSFAGQDSRYNNLTIDGSIFNNSFGLASAPAGQTNSSPISLDAIDQIQVNIAPYDVRQGGFVGAGINAVTRSGTNRFEGSVFANYRTENFAGDSVKVTTKTRIDGVESSRTFNSGVGKQDFVIKQAGFRFGGPLIKDKLFFFVNGEIERREDPATQFKAFRDETITPSSYPNVTRVRASDLEELRRFLISNYNYDPGRYENYPLETYSDKFLVKLDYNLSEQHQISVRYNYLRSFRDVPTSQSGAVNGNRSNNQFALNFEASNYIINNDIHSVIGEINSTFGNKIFNKFQAGFTANRDYRGSTGGVFPLVDIEKDGRTYTTFGYEPFTPNNRLDTDTWQFKDEVSFYLPNNTITAGLNFESFTFENTFTPTYYGQYVYKSLADFYKDASPANPGYDSVSLTRYSLTYSALENGALPIATTKARMPGAYIQDEISLLDNRLTVTAGLRVDVPYFANTALKNPRIDTLTFRDEDQSPVKYTTDKLPDPQFMFSPRLGFNYDLLGDRKVQLRGGTGIFTGRPAFVWISNQVGNNGILTGSFTVNNTTPNDPVKYFFSPDVTRWIPDNASTPASYVLNFTDPNFKFPQIWRSNIAVDVKLPLDIAATVEYIYSKNLNEVQYINANLEAPSGNFAGADNRPFFPGLGLSGAAQNNANRINDFVNDGAIVLKNEGKGNSQSLTFKLERQFKSGLYAMAAYNFAQAKDLITAGSIAFSSWRDNRSVRGNNLPDLAFSDNDQRHRIIGALSYRLDYFNFGATTLSLFFQTGNQGRASVFYNGDYNGDQLNQNDLMYIPNSSSELTFANITSIGSYDSDPTPDTVVISGATQAAAFDAFLNGDDYLSENKGKYAERNGLLLPWLSTIDLSLQQEFYVTVGGRKHRLQLRGDLYNFGNLLNKEWGVGDAVANNNALSVAGPQTNPDGTKVQRVRFGSVNSAGKYVTPVEILTKRASLADVWQLQIGVRYIFD